MRLQRFVALFVCVCITLITLTSCMPAGLFAPVHSDHAHSYAEIQDTVTVSVATGDGYTVKSQNPIRVQRGKSAAFTLEIDEGYAFVSCSSGAVYEDGRLTLSDALFPETIQITLRKLPTVPGGNSPDNPSVQPHDHVGGTAICARGAVCTVCGIEYSDALGHDFAEEYSFDGSGHWLACLRDGCTAKSELEEHTDLRSDCLLGIICNKCGFTCAPAEGHDFAKEYSSDSEGHWYACLNPGCGANSGYAPHSGGVATCTEAAKCEVCQREYGEPLGHRPKGEFDSDGEQHFIACANDGCNEIMFSEPHRGGTDSCTEGAECAVCGRVYGKPHGHDYSEKYTFDTDGHWYVCNNPGCDSISGNEPHYGGIADCDSGRICEGCGAEYGAAAGHVIAKDYSYDSLGHWYSCNRQGCTHSEGYELHYGGTPTAEEQAVCEGCGIRYGGLLTEDPNQHVHSGGSASCDEAPVCTECGQSYGKPLGHIWATEYTSDGERHWYRCRNAGCNERNAEASHTGGSASCTEQAVCTECGAAYGDALGHNWDDAYSFDSEGHWYACLNDGCNERRDSGKHTGGSASCDEPPVCTECLESYGDALGHNWADEYSFDGEGHWYRCLNRDCDARKGEGRHSGGAADCTTQAVCSECGNGYGGVSGHRWATEYSSDKESHWYACLNGDCTERASEQRHFGPSPTCEEDSVCTGCGTVFALHTGHSFSNQYSSNRESHWKECANGCGTRQDEGKHYGGTATATERARCEACGKSYGSLKTTETVILSAEPRDGYRFICWTVNTSAEEGGAVFGEDAAGTYEIPIGASPVANYVDIKHHVVLYRTNGGKTSDGKDYYYQTFSNEHYLMPNTLLQDGTFVRSGYMLMRYATEADGSGDYTTLGGKIEGNANGFSELWLVWEKETEQSTFTYELVEDTDSGYAVRIQRYLGSNSKVILPSHFNVGNISYPVKQIAEGAFESAGLTELGLPHTLVTVEDGAFRNCKLLSTLTLHDNVWYMKDAAFDGCDELGRIYLNAGRLPTHAGNGEGMFSMKYERLRMASTRGDKKIMVVSGSSSLYGFSARQMQEAFNNEYTVINYGTNASVNTYFYIEAFMQYFGEGDIIIQAPETVNPKQMGSWDFEWRVLRGCESMYEVFSFVDMRKYTGFFNSLTEFNQTVRNTQTGKPYESWSRFLDEYSDLTTNVDNPDYKSQTTNYDPYNVNVGNMGRYNALYEIASSKNVRMYLSFAPVNADACKSNSKDPAVQAAFVEKLEQVLDYPVISDPADYLLERNLFNNSDYHPGITGRAIRTERLIADLRARLILEGIIED